MVISYKKNQPFVEGVAINNLVKKIKTPFYLYSQKIITRTYRKLKKDLKSEIFYSVKANSNQAILILLKSLGAGADVVSKGELKRVLLAGFNPKKIIFEGVGKSKEDLIYAIDNKIRLINIESIEEINLINTIGKSRKEVINIGIRMNPEIDSNSPKKISTGKRNDKFGISIDKLNQLIDLNKQLKFINIKGISCHIGSQIENLKIFKKLFLRMKKIVDIFLSNKISIKYIDLGGGFKVSYEKDFDYVDLHSIGKLAQSIFKNTSCKLSFEPGRYAVARSGIIITKILTSKKNGETSFLITDAGMQTLLRPSMYGSFHRIKALNSIDKKNVSYTVAGPICESSDIISKNILLPSQKTLNYLAILDVGAYGSVMSSNYNTREMPAEILINKKNYSLIRKKQKISDIIKKDKIPSWLKSN